MIHSLLAKPFRCMPSSFHPHSPDSISLFLCVSVPLSSWVEDSGLFV